MKKLVLVLALLAAALPVCAGVTYNFKSTTTGLHEGVLAGTVAVEGKSMRMDVTQGDDMLFKEGGVVLSTDGGKTLKVFDPYAKTYYEINLDDLAGSASSMLGSLGGMFKLSFENPKLSVRNLGDGEPLSGYPTHRAVLDAAYDISIDMAGQKMTTHMTMVTESWTTDQLSAEYSNFLQAKSFRSGFPELDKLIDAQSKAIRGEFPLKQVSTIHVLQGSNDIKSASTSLVKDIEKKTIGAAMFAAPSGYTKVDNPIERMMKNLK